MKDNQEQIYLKNQNLQILEKEKINKSQGNLI